ncbi:hypothetical protein LuPra_01361 [Luteitalea pratensis]|uniref:Uncharacterized protein n=1 Tax=Luteitalea pratensis TaxID=1855912 RepID=A0A143PK86_LUTPR|nr:hypothetical protein LuPra_01361 [Luteitalea pratensis]
MFPPDDLKNEDRTVAAVQAAQSADLSALERASRVPVSQLTVGTWSPMRMIDQESVTRDPSGQATRQLCIGLVLK